MNRLREKLDTEGYFDILPAAYQDLFIELVKHRYGALELYFDYFNSLAELYNRETDSMWHFIHNAFNPDETTHQREWELISQGYDPTGETDLYKLINL